ncbi:MULTISPECIES: hypothetical protein [unclassified Mycobacterium]|uniref:hypothetical protein n=1 Tax=unclassified Mycobacterium TaxID=2642494 RepID=UPI0029C86C7D|nr:MULTISPECIES: hypothetical protein [unclassified Mycobacterium]
MARTGRFSLGRVTLLQLADVIDNARDLGYGPTARVEVVLEITDPRAPEIVTPRPAADSHNR